MVNPLDKGVAELGVAAKAKPLSAAAANTYDSFLISKLLDYAPLRRETGALVHRRLNYNMVPRWGIKLRGRKDWGNTNALPRAKFLDAVCGDKQNEVEVLLGAQDTAR